MDALAILADERRGSLRKASGRWQQSVIRRCLNGETYMLEEHMSIYIGVYKNGNGVK